MSSGGDGHTAQQILVKNGLAGGIQGAEAGLRGPGELDFADNDEVQGNRQGAGDLRRHRHAPGRNGEEVNLLAAVPAEVDAQLLAGAGPIGKDVEAIP